MVDYDAAVRIQRCEEFNEAISPTETSMTRS